MSFRRFAVIGQSPSTIEQDLLDRLAENSLRERDLGIPEEEEYGWSGGRHVLDATFSFENNVYADALLFGLRIDTNKVPADLKKAYQLMEEESAAANNPSGFISKLQKRDAKDVVNRRVDDDLRSGKYRRSKLQPILWDVPAGILYCNASGTTQEKLMEIFERTFDLKLMPISAGYAALRRLEPIGRRRDYEDARPTRFVLGPEGEHQHPEYPWTAKGPEPKDFYGNEFLLWLWHEAEKNGGAIETEGNHDISLMFDRSLDLDCAYGQTGRDSLRNDGVSKMPEALDALRSGKVPRKAGLTIDAGRQQFILNFAAESFSVGSLKLPDVEEADNPRVLFEERVSMLRDFCSALDAMFYAFLKARTGGSWESQTSTIRKWILSTAKTATAPRVDFAMN